jgi:hypothetical protein
VSAEGASAAAGLRYLRTDERMPLDADYMRFASLNVHADRRTLDQEDLDKLVNLLTHRPLQFCLFLAALNREERMDQIMLGSVEQVKGCGRSGGREPEGEAE